MSNLLLDFAVQIDRKRAAPLGSTAFLHRLGVIVTPLAGVEEGVFYATSYGIPVKMYDGTTVVVLGTKDANIADFTAAAATASPGNAYRLTTDGNVTSSTLPPLPDGTQTHKVADITVANLNATDLSAHAKGEAWKMTDAGQVDADGSAAGASKFDVVIGDIVAYDGTTLVNLGAELPGLSGVIGDVIAWDGFQWQNVGSNAYQSGDALNYVAQSNYLGALIDRLSGIYLVTTTNPNTLKTQGESKFFTLTYDETIATADAERAISTWEGVVFVGETVSAGNLYVAKTVGDDVAVRYSALISLLSDVEWRNQQYSQFINTNENASGAQASGQAFAITSLGGSNGAFSGHKTFYLWNDDEGNGAAFLGFLGTVSGLSITSPYVRAEIEIKVQNAFVQMISINEPFNILTTRKVLNSQFSKILKSYIDAGLLDAEGANTAQVLRDDERFYVKGNIQVTNSAALWRARISAYYGETPTSADGTTIAAGV